MTSRIEVLTDSGPFAENKDAAAKLRETRLKPLLDGNQQIEIDFTGVEYATQSFVHAFIAHTIRTNPELLDRITFTNCTDAVQGIIEIVVDYAQEDA